MHLRSRKKINNTLGLRVFFVSCVDIDIQENGGAKRSEALAIYRFYLKNWNKETYARK